MIPRTTRASMLRLYSARGRVLSRRYKSVGEDLLLPGAR